MNETAITTSSKKQTLMKIIDRTVIIFLNLFLLLVSIMLPACCIASSKGFYQTQFEKTGIYATINEDGEKVPATIRYISGYSRNYAHFTDEQLNEMIDHIIDYLFTDKASFALTMDNVMLNGVETDNVEIFGETSVKHMVDVKNLFTLVITLTVIFSLLLVALAVYVILRRQTCAPLLLKYSILFYAVFLGLIGAFCGWVALDAAKNEVPFMSQMWGNFHHLIFPFQEDKFSGSFFNDTLTSILTLEFFLSAVATVLIIVGVIFVLWFACTILIKRLSKE